MSAFSFTAPFISEEEERAEREAFTEEEIQELHRDLYGGNEEEDLPETDELITNGVALLKESLGEIPDSEKEEYLEALQRAPELVERESPAISYLRYTNYDAWAAAQCMVAYWKVRKQHFGPDRTFLPMTLDGALAEDMETFKKALLMLTWEDKSGRKVYFIDRVRCIRSVASRESILRCWFYVYQIIAETERGRRKGFIAIVNLRGFDLYMHFDRILMKRMLGIYNTFPALLRAIHLCTGSGVSVVSLVSPVMKHMMGRRIRHRVVTHAGSDTEIIQRMELYGLEERNIPSILGGSFTHADFDAWLKDRQQFERHGAVAQQEQQLN